MVVNPARHESTAKMVAKRVGWGASGAVHAGLAIAAFQGMSGSSQAGQGGGQKIWLSSMMQESWGPIVIGLLGIGVVGVGLFQFAKAVKLRFLEDVDTGAMSAKEQKVLRVVGRMGLAARGVVFPIIGYFLIQAALTADPNKAKGVGGALHEIAQSGWLMLAVIAIGLTAYGILQLFFAKYRRLSLN